MDELQKYLREASVASKIEASVQKHIKEIIAKDGDVDCVNDRLKAFTATSAGQKILGMAQKIMQEMNLPYTEQVFLQEAGFYPDKGTDIKAGKEESPTVDSLLEMYAKLEKPITQTDGLADESDGIPSLQFDDDFGSGWQTACSSPYQSSPATLTPNARFKRQYLEAFARGEALDASAEDGWETIDDSAMTTLPDSTMGSVRAASAPNISGVSNINWSQSNACSADDSGWETTLGSTADTIYGLEEEPTLPRRRHYENVSGLYSGSSPRRPRSMSVNRRSSSGIISDNQLLRSPQRHSVSIVESSPNRSANYSTSPSNLTCSRLSSRLSQSGNVVPRQADWNHFDSENPAHEQRFFEINDMQKTYLGTALNMLDVLPTVVQVGHTIILNANVYVDERDTKQFTIGGLLPDYLEREEDNRSLGHSPRESSLSTPCTPRSPRSIRTPGAPVVARSGGRSPRGGYGRRLNFSREPQGSMTCTPVMASPLGETPRTPNVARRMRSPRSARGVQGRQLSFERSPMFYSIDAEEPFIVQGGRCTRDAVGRPMAIVGGRRHGFFPDENEDVPFVDPNLTPVEYAEFELPDEFEIDMMRGQ